VQGLSRRLVIGDPEDFEAAAALGFVDAVLAVDFGFETRREAEEILKRIPREKPQSTTTTALAGAAEALIQIDRGDRQGALRLAAATAEKAPGLPYPLYALARARARSADLSGAADACQAALVGTPGFTPANVAMAEVLLDGGDTVAANEALIRGGVTRSTDPRAVMLMDEILQAMPSTANAAAGAGPSPSKEAKDLCKGATESPRPVPYTKSWCALAQAGRARRSGDRPAALTYALAAAEIAPREPRLLARIAGTLAQLGAVDRAQGQWDKSRTLVAPETPSLAWARVAIGLGRGRAVPPPTGPTPDDPEISFLAARSALSSGGTEDLRQVMAGLGPSAVSADADLRILSGLLVSGIGKKDTDEDPMRAYVSGLRAQLAGDLPEAAERYWHGLSGHGDACRALGEYVATLRLLKVPPDPKSWAGLRAENAGCINLR